MLLIGDIKQKTMIRSNFEIIKEKIPFGVQNVKAIGKGNGKPQYEAEKKIIAECMDIARKDSSVAFAQYVLKEWSHRSPEFMEETYKIFIEKEENNLK